MSVTFGPVSYIEATAILAIPRPRARAVDTSGNVASFKIKIGLNQQTYNDIVQLRVPRPLGIIAFLSNDGIASLPVPRPAMYASAFAPPAINIAYLPLPIPRLTAVAFSNISGQAMLPVPRPHNVRAITNGNFAASLAIPKPGTRASNTDYSSAPFFYAVQSPGYISMLTGTPMMAIDDSANLSVDPFALAMGITFDDMMNAADATSGLMPLRHMLINDAAFAEDFVALVSWIICTSTANATTALTIDHNILLTLADVMVANDATLTIRQALIAISTLMAAKDSTSAISLLQMIDSAVATTTLSELAGRILSTLSTAAATDLATPKMHMIAAISDDMAMTDNEALLRHMLLHIDDLAFLGGRFVFDNEAYTIYAVQPVGVAVSEYTNMQYDSMTTIDGVTYGVNHLGVFALEGADDDGTPIQGSVYTGLTNFGSSLIKEVPYVYAGLQKSGQLLLKVTTTAKGVRKENWYTTTTKSMDAISNVRFQISKGLQAQYWGFELANVDGEDFDVDFVKAWVLALNRRV